MPYAWDFPAAQWKEIVLRSGGRERNVQLAEIGDLLPMNISSPQNGGSAMVDLNVFADGITQSLQISNYNPKTSMYQLKANQSATSVSASQDKFETITDDNYFRSIIFRFEGMGISLINRKGQELCYTTLRGVEMRYNESDILQNFSLKLKWLQVDNQLYPSIYPIIVYPTVVPKSSIEMNSHPVFSTAISKVKDDTHGVTYIKLANLLLQELSVEVDEDFLFALLDFSKIPGASWNQQTADNLWDENMQVPEPPAIRTSDDYYFEHFTIQPLQFNLSFTRTERLNADETSDANNALERQCHICFRP
ncbi:unnamed protein product [Ambrosiozyma monospora]|uniref:Unnamed protein product n=1 Tax=Ambrosiozyma monospora TaxID=43982 RepID=A0A9W6T6S5_AMBMO|nr:unnamed protein product [Ambrosiozyma monospora]